MAEVVHPVQAKTAFAHFSVKLVLAESFEDDSDVIQVLFFCTTVNEYVI
jgi:hypothetical protein